MKKEHILLTSVCALGAIAAVSVSLFVWKSVTSGGVTPPAPVEEYCIVNFDSKGGSYVEAQKVKKGEKAIKPNNPYHEPKIEYTFKGWFTDDGRDYDFSQVVTNDITLNAKWERDPQPNKHIVRFEAGGGTIEGQDFITVTEGSTISKAPTVNRPGYDASQVTWWTEATGGEQFIFGDEGTQVDHDYFLHARWGDIKTYTVYFKDADDESGVYEDQIIEYNHVVQRPVDPTKTGFTFDKWYSEDKETEFDFETPLTGEDTEITIYAKWNEIEPVISESIVMAAKIGELSKTVSFECVTNGQHKVNWGDGTETDVGSSNTHTYNNAGIYNISIYGEGLLDSLALTEGQDKTWLTGIITQNIVKISDKAFSDCTALTYVSISNNVESIGELAFSNCSSLVNFNFDEPSSSLKSIGKDAFQGCPSSLFKTYKDCKYISTIKNPCYALISCFNPSTSNVFISESCVIIADYAFERYSNLETVTFEEESQLTSIGNFAFYRCSSLSSITIPDSVTSIGMNAFEQCSSLDNITIPDSVTSIGMNAFAACASLSSISIPSNVTSIGINPFAFCPSLTHIDVDENNKVYEDRDINAIIEKATNTLITGPYDAVIPDDITSIGNQAFFGCTFSSITIPNSVTSIGEMAFYGCVDLQSITFEEESKLEIIKIYAFYYCSSLSSITIPNGVTLIDEHTFEECASLASVTILGAVTSIGEMAFCGCESLAFITIPNSVTSIGTSAFEDCSNLQTVTFGDESKLETIGESAFKYCDVLASITIPDSVTSIGSSAFYRCVSLAVITIPNSVTSIGNDAFYSCSNLKSVDLTTYTTSSTIPTYNGSSFMECSSELKFHVASEAIKGKFIEKGWPAEKIVIDE